MNLFIYYDDRHCSGSRLQRTDLFGKMEKDILSGASPRARAMEAIGGAYARLESKQAVSAGSEKSASTTHEQCSRLSHHVNTIPGIGPTLTSGD
jgi:hypothetical protein